MDADARGAEPGWAQEFQFAPGLSYLNHAGVGPWPRRSAEAVCAFARENALNGAADYPRWVRREAELRQALGRLIGAGADEVALVKNTSEGLSFVAAGLPWRPGDNVVSSDQEFPSNRYVWEALGRQGVGLRCAPLGAGARPEDALMAACDPRTRLLAVSAVQYATGLRLDLERLGGFCRERGILFCVDAIQWLGADAFDVERIGADFVVADGHKWMLGPEGLALFYVRAGLRERLRLTEVGWHSVAAAGDYERCLWKPDPGARRFECGSPNLLGAHALAASVELLLEVGLAEVHARLAANLSYLIERLEALPGVRLVTPRAPERRCGILTFRLAGHEPAQLHAELRRRGVVGAVRAGGLRWSPHFYTPRTALDHALAALAELLGG